MDISAMGIGQAALLFALPAALAGIGKLAAQRGEGFDRGWCGILFIALCAGLALEAILGRVAA